MKKFFTLLFVILSTLVVEAQTSDFPLQFADKDGNIIADGSILNLSEYEEDAFGDVQIPTNLYVKNISGEAVQGGGTYTIQSMDNGTFQTCFPESCVRQTKAGSYNTGNGAIEAGAMKSMQTEWFPTAEGVCVVAYKLVTFSQNSKTGKWMKDGDGPTVTLNFNYGSSGINSATAQKQVRQLEYYDIVGRQVKKPTNGVYIVKEIYADGSKQSRKKLFLK